MAMTQADAIKALRAGHYSENIMAQITSQAVIDDKEDVDLNGGSYQWPILSGYDGVLHIAQSRYVDGSTIYNSGIQRITGLGDVFGGELRGNPSTGAGTLTLALGDSSIMIEVADIDWADSVIKVRLDMNKEGWNDSIELFSGVISDAEVKKQGTELSFRVDGNQWFLNEKIRTLGPLERNPFGWCSKYPVTTDHVIPDKSPDNDFYYYATHFASEDKSYAMYREDVSISNTDGAVISKVEANGSASWNGGSIPTDNVFIAAKGFNATGFKQKAGEIITVAKANVISNLPNITLNATSLTNYDAACGHYTGFLFDNQVSTHNPDGEIGERSQGYNTWNEALDTLVGGTGGLTSFNRQGELCIYYMLRVPTGLPTLTLRKNGDFSKYTVDKVNKIDRAELGMPNEFPAGDGSPVNRGDSDYYNSREGAVRTVAFDTSMSHDAHAVTLGDRYLSRFGTGDYKFTDCLIARALSIGDVVDFEEGIDNHLDTTNLKGYVIGVERGDKPFLVVRA